MIVDFQHHFTPRELIKEDPGDKLIVRFDENGAPSYTVHSLLYDLDEHIRMMDAAGIDAAFLTSANGMSAPLDISRICNDKAKQAERDYPGRWGRPAWSLPPRWTANSSTTPRWSHSGPRPSGSACSCSFIRRSS
jgi:hypothetical protein